MSTRLCAARNSCPGGPGGGPAVRGRGGHSLPQARRLRTAHEKLFQIHQHWLNTRSVLQESTDFYLKEA